MSNKTEHQILADVAVNLFEHFDEYLRDKVVDPDPTHYASVLGILTVMVNARLTDHMTSEG